MTDYIEPSIPEYYSGKNIFITGGTGFLGKALIEKFLRSCPDIGDIYILVRQKKGKHVQERIKTLTDDPIFERVKLEQPDLIIEKKVIALGGDATQLNLGLSPEDRNTLVEKVNIIFHAAASIRFDDPLSQAIIMNVRGTREVCQLALDAKNIMAYIHVSTTYVNCDRNESKEILYSPKFDWKNSIEIAEKFNKFELSVFTPKIVSDLPNTYTFTKQIAEHVVKDMLEDKIPCKIYRPSVVIAALQDEPVKGWIDSLNGPVGILLAGLSGILRSVYFHSSIRQDYIPVDVVIKSIIVCAWDIAVRSSFSNTILPLEVINGSACNVKWLRIHAGAWSDYCIGATDMVPLNDIVWIPYGHYTSNFYSWYLRTIFTMILPSIFIDLVSKLKGKQPRLLKIQKRMYLAQIVLAPIAFKENQFCNDNLLALQNRIQERDKPSFDYDFENCDFKDYIYHMLMGGRRYILNSPDSTLESAKKHYNKMWWIQKIVNAITLIMFIVFMYFLVI